MSGLVKLASVTLVGLLPFLSTGLLTTPESPGLTAEQDVSTSATTYTVDPVHSTALFRVHHLQAGQFWGRFNQLSGTINVGENLDTLAFDITIDVNSVDTNTERLDNHLKSPDFFNAREYPTMAFKSKSVSRVDEKTFKVTGDLTIHGVTREIVADIEHTGSSSIREPRIGFEAQFTVNRSDFNVNYGVENGIVGNETRVIVGLEAIGSGG